MMRNLRFLIGGLFPVLAIVAAACAATMSRETRWSEEEIEEIASLWIGELEPLPTDPTNRWADDPAAAAFGQRLFFDTRLSVNGKVSCGSCHMPGRQFQDDAPLATGVGRTDRRTMPIAGTAYSPWLFWDGRKDSQWSQALGPLESPVEHGGSRALYAHVVAEHHREEYEAIFGPLPDLSGVPRNAGPVPDPEAAANWAALPPEKRDEITDVFVNIGKAIAAYERRLQPGESRFDRYAAALLAEGHAPDSILTPEEEAGLRIFVGKGNCIQCHNGPLFTDDHFHNTGVAAAAGLPVDLGRAAGAPKVLADEFNCRSRHSDAPAEVCVELEFLAPEGEELTRAFKTPSLRGVADRAPYMHAGQIASLTEVVEHYSRAPRSPAGTTETRPLRLSARERAQLEAYLRTLDNAVAAPPELLMDPYAEGEDSQ